jgi:hypothetical protein
MTIHSDGHGFIIFATAKRDLRRDTPEIFTFF